MDIPGRPIQLTRAVQQELSPREREVLGLMALGYANQAICAELWLSRKTVETHIRSIFMKLGVGTLDGRDRRVTAVLAFLEAVETEAVAA